MTRWRPELRVDVRGSAPGVLELVPAGGAFAVAMRGIAGCTGVPDDVRLTLYAYELLERLREAAAGEAPAVVHAPFWPMALFAAADVRIHAGEELAAMYPEFSRVRVSARQADATAATAKALFGCVPFDPVQYSSEVIAIAAQRGWVEA